MPRILLIDDDAQLGPPLAAYFQRFDLTLEQALRPSTGLARLAQGGFDEIIVATGITPRKVRIDGIDSPKVLSYIDVLAGNADVGPRVAVIGAGGSARAICYGLNQRGAAVTIFARDLHKAQSLADEFNTKLAALDTFSGDTDIVINCTPIGMLHHSEGQSPLRADSLAGVKLVYDLIYTPEDTALLRDANAAGCQTLGGLAMLVGQAREQFRLWTGLEAPLEVMWQAASRGV